MNRLFHPQFLDCKGSKNTGLFYFLKGRGPIFEKNDFSFF